MELDYAPEDEAFRAEIRSWLHENLPKGWFEPGFEMSNDERKKFNDEWPSKLFKGGWICATWPKEYGGKEGGNLGMAVIRDHLAAKGLGLHCDLQNEHSIVGNNPFVLMFKEFATNEQYDRYADDLLNGRMRTGYHLAAPGETVSRVGLTVQQALGIPISTWGTESNATKKSFSEVLA